MQKIIISIIVFILLCLIVLILFLFSAKNEDKALNAPSVIYQNNVPNSDQLIIVGKKGDLLVRNFLKNATKLDGSRVEVVADVFWSVVYEPLSGYFYITLGASDVDDANNQIKAITEKLKQMLSINDICAIKYEIIVTNNTTNDKFKLYGCS